MRGLVFLALVVFVFVRVVMRFPTDFAVPAADLMAPFATDLAVDLVKSIAVFLATSFMAVAAI